MILVIGSGVAGLSAALAAMRAGGDVTLVTAGPLGDAQTGNTPFGNTPFGNTPLGNTPLAQGGIAAAIGAEDRGEDHLADTLAAGAGLSDPEVAALLVRAGADEMRRLLADGLEVDRDASGAVRFGLEAAHGRPRILHAGGDRTGAVLHAHLVALLRAFARRTGRLVVHEYCELEHLIVEAGAVVGARMRARHGASVTYRADAVVLATGGYASLYPVSSNHAAARGSGIVAAARAGAVLADLEFVQFHPTVLVEEGAATAAGPRLLISEAVRGAGAVLRDRSGARFMAGRDPRAELAPRDVVALEIHRTLRRSATTAVWLDATAIERDAGSGTLARRFPGISAALAARGLDWCREPIPVAPAAHYTMGGVVSDVDGRSSVPGLCVAGEVASTGVHGANRLASNSLLEGLVFGARAGKAAALYAPRTSNWQLQGRGTADLTRTAEPVAAFMGEPEAGIAAASQAVSRAVGAYLGIERDHDGLRAAGHVFEAETGDAAALAALIGVAAAARTESRGAHRRADHPDADPAQDRRRAWRAVIGSAPRHSASRGAGSAAEHASQSVHAAHEQRSTVGC